MNASAFSLSCLLSIIFLTNFIQSQTYKMIVHEECGVEFWIPPDWGHQIDEDLLIIQSPEEELKLFFLTSGIQVLGQATDALLEEISRVVTQPEVASVSRQQEHNGLLYYTAQGFGLYLGDIVDWELRFVAGARKSLMIIALGELETNRHTVEQIFDTIQLIKLESESRS